MLRSILNHPLNRSNRLGAMTRWAGWQAWKVLARRPMTTRFWNQLRVRVYPDWPYSWTAIYFRLDEYDDMMFTLRYLRPGDVFLDVGANIGIYSLLASSVNGGAQVLAFEPHPTASDRLRENAALNRLTNIQVIEAALGEETGLGQMTTDLFEQNRIAGSGDTGIGTTVRLATLDDELRQQRIDPACVAMVKIDTEGFESRVLRGAASLLSCTPGPVWIVELLGFGARYGSDDAEILSLFARHGYTPFQFNAERNEVVGVRDRTAHRGNVIFARHPDEIRTRLHGSAIERGAGI